MDNFKQNFLNALKTTGKKITKIVTAPLKPFLIILIIILIVFALVLSSYDALMDQFSKQVGEHMQNNAINVEYDESNSIIISEEQVKPLEELLVSMGTSKEKLHLTTEQLQKIYAAEVVPQEINRGVPEEEGKFYGRIYVKKATDSTEEQDLQDLTYIDLEQFEQLGADEITNYFSVDGAQLCVANIRTETDSEGNTTEQINIEKLNYKNIVTPYIMPVEFLLDLCIVTGNPNFVMALADKVLNETEIIIAVMEEEETVETTTTISYQIETETVSYTVNYDENGNYINREYNDPVIDVSEPQTESSTETVTTITPVVKVISIKSWFIEQVYTYNKVTTSNETEIGPDDPSNEMEDEEKVTSYQYELVEVIENEDGSSSRVYEDTNERRINQEKTVNININKTTYQEGITKEPVDKAEEFLTLLKTPFTKPNSTIKEPAIGNIVSGAGILLQMLQNSERTQTVEHIMRYILYVYTGDNYGVTELDLSLFEPGELTSLSEYYGTGFWWPIGGSEIEVTDGKEFATGEPTTTNISSHFGNRTSPTAGASVYHQAIDIGSNGYGTNYHNIIASADGVVTRVRDGQADGVQSPSEGNFVEIDHGNGIKTIYKHLYIGSIRVEVGDSVEQGQLLAKMGNSGVSTGAHLHFEVRVNGTAVDPEEYVSAENPRPVGGSASSFSLNSTTFSQEEFKAKMLEYATKSGNSNFKTNFADNADEIYTASLNAGVNPELVVVTAGCESGWTKNSHNNYWGIGIPNGGSISDGPYFATLTDGIKRYASVIASYQPGGSQAGLITQRYEERKADNCNPNGYGMPGTFAGMQSVYSDLVGTPNIHKVGGTGSGGNYYLRIIYGSEFDEKCGNVHQIGVDPYTNQERADYTAWQCQEKVELRYAIFGL